ncbi:hypothetical protein R1sor_023720 [Riccia sorocarpa]|uniref:SWIM-type domain-containing protein n=1 Tax=Riccia sorocarpa TaxID=122646 RepID=A0ABD3GUD2_9MARC
METIESAIGLTWRSMELQQESHDVSEEEKSGASARNLLSCNAKNHVDENELFCHGLFCPDARISNAQIAPRLSAECIQFVERLLRSRVPPAEIILEHQERIAEVVRSSGDRVHWSRDIQLTSIDIRNIQAQLRREGHLYHHEESQALKQWTERFPENVIHYTEQNREEKKPFCLVFSTPWMLKNLAVFGHDGAVCLDATHGTNKYGFQLFTWLVYDKHQNGVPAAWAILERYKTEDLQVVQEKVKEKVECIHRDLLGEDGYFKPSCFITDDCAAEKASIRNVYPGCPIDLCIWHVRCAFNKNLMSKVSHPVHRAVMNKELAAIMYTKDPDTIEVNGVKVKVFESVKPDMFHTVMDWGSKESSCSCSMNAMGNLCKHEVKALLMDGVTETEIVKTLGRKAGTSAGGMKNLSLNRVLPLDLNAEPTNQALLEEPQFRFPFALSDYSPEERLGQEMSVPLCHAVRLFMFLDFQSVLSN